MQTCKAARRLTLAYASMLAASAALAHAQAAPTAPADRNQATIDYWSQATAKLAAMPHGVWSREGEYTIKFEGPIGQVVGGQTDLDRLNAVLRPGDQVYIVNSNGGNVRDGLAMGRRLAPLKMRVVVDGTCFSSCANYLFTAGDQKEIKFGYVGFHGNQTAMVTQDWEREAAALARQGESVEAIARTRLAWEANAALEQDFLQAQGIRQELFNLSSRLDKGSPDGQEYYALLPGPEMFAAFGIKNVTGVQDVDFCAQHDPTTAQLWFRCTE